MTYRLRTMDGYEDFYFEHEHKPAIKEPNSVIGIMGFMGAGKDTVADIFIGDDYQNNHKYSFAGPLKDMCSYVFDIPKVWMYDQELKKRSVRINMSNNALRDRMHEWVISEISNKPKWAWHLARPELSAQWEYSTSRTEDVSGKLIGVISDIFYRLIKEGKVLADTDNRTGVLISIRLLLQYMGTEVVRETIDDKFWAEIKESPSTISSKTVYIPDCRFSNEVDFIIEHPRGEIIVVQNTDLEMSNTPTHVSEEFVTQVADYIADKYPNKSVHYVHNSFQCDSMNDLTTQINILKAKLNTRGNQ